MNSIDTVSDQFNCPKCGAHDYGLWAPQIGDCRWCLTKDAERYRWARQQSVDDLMLLYIDLPGKATPQEWDAAIDAEMSRHPVIEAVPAK